MLQASKKLEGIPAEEVISWPTESSKRWHYGELLYGVKNIEETFGARFDSKRLIELYFEEPDLWLNTTNTEMLEDFNRTIGREISVNDVAKVIDVDFVRESIEFDVGISGFIEFICDNGGDTGSFVKRLVSIADKLNQ